MIRVLLIAPSLDIVGGHSVQARSLLQHYANDSLVKAQFLAINPRLPGPFSRLQRIRYVRTLVTSFAYMLSLLAAVQRCDVLHVFAAGYWSFLLAPVPAMIVGRLFGKKVLLNYHDGRAEEHLQRWPVAKRLMQLAHAIVVPSDFLVDVFSRFGIRACAIYNTADPSAFRFRDRARPRPVFLHNRGLEPTYNVPCTLRAFSRIQKRYPDASLTIAHDGPLRQALQALTAELDLRNVVFRGFVSPLDTPGVYDGADIYLCSTAADNMPLSLLECFASGLPVVWSRVGGVPYMLESERTGLMFEHDDDAGMAECAFRYLEEPGLASRIARAGREELRKYSWEAIGPQWISLYCRLTGAGEPAAVSDTPQKCV